MFATPIQNRYDAIVVGARCAGAATAMLLARQGAKVLLIDRGAHGTDTMSTHALMRAAVMQLSHWGLIGKVVASGAQPVTTTSFLYEGEEPIDIAIKPGHGTSALYAPRRYALDAILSDAAVEAGVDLHYGAQLVDLLRGPHGGVTGAVLRDRTGSTHEVAAGIVIGADGRHSTVAKLTGAATIKRAHHASMCVYAYADGLPNRGFRWFWAEGAAGGIIPTNEGHSCVFLSLPRTETRTFRTALSREGFRDALSTKMPGLAAETAEAAMATRPVGFPGEPGYLRRACGDGWALVGDAGYFKDPLTAHGISDALRDAQVLADAIVMGCTDHYAATRDAISGDMLTISDRIGSFEWTLDELMALHDKLNRTMKANHAWIAENLHAMAIAA
ncbi:NAD(P)/FAD-dependent oxidoreductase [Croceicoccus bisphenolivorans]|uniref:NAD(P)/FAD-dependent oxidoreductase n=1 Tax=Croceicoccus bisphenolivorans TaxID=1783232 RepID=UPI00082E8138|nr:NAD(P)/FAD-dependent oxidoreductase [Croceicoccus bisphenolivorans]